MTENNSDFRRISTHRNSKFLFSIGSGKIVNHTVMTEYHEHSRILQANFRNMTLRDKGRGDRRGTESVAEEKFSIVFQVLA